MLVKRAITTLVTPAVEAVEGHAASLVCTPPPPAVEPEAPPPAPPPPVPGNPPDPVVTYYVYVPNNPNDFSAGEVRTPLFDPPDDPPAGYTCDIVPTLYYVPDPSFPGGTMPVYEQRCYWNYPP